MESGTPEDVSEVFRSVCGNPADSMNQMAFNDDPKQEAGESKRREDEKESLKAPSVRESSVSSSGSCVRAARAGLRPSLVLLTALLVLGAASPGANAQEVIPIGEWGSP